MIYLYWAFIVCFLFPLLVGLISRKIKLLQLEPDFSTRFPAYFKALDKKVPLAYGINGALLVMLIVYGHKVVAGDVPFLVLIIAPLVMYICTARLFYLRFKDLLLKYSAARVTKVLFALLVFLAVWLSNVYTDSVFINYTRIASSDLPTAKAGVLAIVTIFVWVMLLSMLILIPYLLMAFTIRVATPAATSSEAIMCAKPKILNSPPLPSSHVTFTLFFGLAFSSMSAPHLVSYTSKNPAFEPFVRKLIAYASFHLEESQCAGRQPKGSVFAPLGYERLAIAIPDEEKGYLFKTIKCPDGNAPNALTKKPKVTVPLEFDQQSL